MSKRILVAGIGNIFHGDDAFGVETAQQMMQQPQREDVHVADFGIRSYDLAFAIMNGYDTTILVDATQRGNPPGTLYLIEPDLDALETRTDGEEIVNAHGLTPATVLQMVRSFGATPGKIYLVACEPAVLEPSDGEIGLSPQVSAAVPEAIAMVESLIHNLLDDQPNAHPDRELIHQTKEN